MRPTQVPVCPIELALGSPGATIVDLRTPGEFAQDHLPGAHNVPLFDDVERAVVGTLYKRVSRQAAFERGRAFTLGRIHGLVATIAEHAGWTTPTADLAQRVEDMTAEGIDALEGTLGSGRVDSLPERPLILHCWRGGLRSRSVVAFVRALGHGDAFGLEGGYKAYRRHVLERLEAWRAPSAYVLRGLTGVGKTLVLRELGRLRPGWTLDLEGLAGHRGSLLGMVGLEPCPQKAFESRLVARLAELGPGPLVVEGESRKVGDSVLPSRVWDAIQTGVNLRLVASPERRQRVLVEDYLGRNGDRAALRRQLEELQPRVPTRERLAALLEAGRVEELVALLLERYYDPLYRRSDAGRPVAETIDASDPGGAAAEIIAWIEAREAGQRSDAGPKATPTSSRAQ